MNRSTVNSGSAFESKNFGVWHTNYALREDVSDDQMDDLSMSDNEDSIDEIYLDSDAGASEAGERSEINFSGARSRRDISIDRIDMLSQFDDMDDFSEYHYEEDFFSISVED